MTRTVHWITVAAMFAFGTGLRHPALPMRPPVLVTTRAMSRRRGHRPARLDAGTLRHFGAVPVREAALVSGPTGWPF